jgi:hypothetical protein
MVAINNPYVELTDNEMNELIEKILDEIWSDVRGDWPDACGQHFFSHVVDFVYPYILSIIIHNPYFQVNN